MPSTCASALCHAAPHALGSASAPRSAGRKRSRSSTSACRAGVACPSRSARSLQHITGPLKLPMHLEVSGTRRLGRASRGWFARSASIENGPTCSCDGSCDPFLEATDEDHSCHVHHAPSTPWPNATRHPHPAPVASILLPGTQSMLRARVARPHTGFLTRTSCPCLVRRALRVGLMFLTFVMCHVRASHRIRGTPDHQIKLRHDTREGVLYGCCTREITPAQRRAGTPRSATGPRRRHKAFRPL